MKTKIALFGLLTAGLLALPVLSHAQDAAGSSTTASAPAKTKHGAPFHGTVDALDTNAMTLTVGSRTFQITSETRIMKDDKPAVLANGAVGQPVTGYYKPADDGGTTLDASSVYFGTHAKAKPAVHRKKKASETSVTNAPPVPPATSPVPPPPALTPPPAPPAMTGTNSQ